MWTDDLNLLHQRLSKLKDLSNSHSRELAILENNRRMLEEQAAFYGLEVPLKLLNEIDCAKDKAQKVRGERAQIEEQIAEVKDEIIEYSQRQRDFSRRDHIPRRVEPACFDTYHAWPGFDKYAKDAKEIFVAGGSLDTLIELYRVFLVQKAESGCKVRLILMDPASLAIPQVELWSGPGLPPGHFHRAICRSLQLLAATDVNRKLEVRFDPSIPAQSVVILDGCQPHGRIRVDLQPFQCLAVQRPVFELTLQGPNKRWYDLFYRQYASLLWHQATPVDLSEPPKACSQFEVEVIR